MSRRPKQKPEYRDLARIIANDSIVTQALAKFIEQIVEETAKEARRLERVRCEDILQRHRPQNDPNDWTEFAKIRDQCLSSVILAVRGTL